MVSEVWAYRVDYPDDAHDFGGDGGAPGTGSNDHNAMDPDGNSRHHHYTLLNRIPSKERAAVQYKSYTQTLLFFSCHSLLAHCFTGCNE